MARTEPSQLSVSDIRNVFFIFIILFAQRYMSRQSDFPAVATASKSRAHLHLKR